MTGFHVSAKPHGLQSDQVARIDRAFAFRAVD